jgi:hypothetical protein
VSFFTDFMSVLKNDTTSARRCVDRRHVIFSDFMSVNEKRIYIDPTLCHFFWLYVGHWKTNSGKPDVVSFFIWLYVGHWKTTLCRPNDVSFRFFIEENLPKLAPYSFCFFNWGKMTRWLQFRQYDNCYKVFL